MDIDMTAYDVNHLVAKHIAEYNNTNNSTHLYQITRLDMSGIYLFEMPYEINLLRGLVTLDMSGCKLNKIPREISLLQKLIKLDLSSNDLTDLPNELSSMGKLRILHLEGNKFQKVPAVLGKMELSQLLYKNPLKKLPAFLGEELKSYPPGASK